MKWIAIFKTVVFEEFEIQGVFLLQQHEFRNRKVKKMDTKNNVVFWCSRVIVVPDGKVHVEHKEK